MTHYYRIHYWCFSLEGHRDIWANTPEQALRAFTGISPMARVVSVIRHEPTVR